LLVELFESYDNARTCEPQICEAILKFRPTETSDFWSILFVTKKNLKIFSGFGTISVNSSRTV